MFLNIVLLAVSCIVPVGYALQIYRPREPIINDSKSVVTGHKLTQGLTSNKLKSCEKENNETSERKENITSIFFEQFTSNILENPKTLDDTDIDRFLCPNSAEIEPCTCSSKTSNGNGLTCSDVDSFEDLKDILNAAYFPSTNFDYFLYEPQNASIDQEVLLNNTFGPLSFKGIYIAKSGLEIMEEAALNGSQDTLQMLYLDANEYFYSFPFESILSDFNQLITLVIIKSALDNLPHLDSSTLKNLYLYDNNLSYLYYDTFRDLILLDVLDLGYNNIQNVIPNGLGLYLKAKNFMIYLDNNELTDMYPFIYNQPHILDESHNYLTTFSQDVYEPILDSSSYVDVSYNDIDCSELGWIDEKENSYILSDCDNNILPVP